MSTKFKYVVLMKGTMETPIVFPNWLTHKEMVPYGIKAVSAGFLDIIATPKVMENTISFSHQIDFICSGNSVSLNVASRPKEDSELLYDLWKQTLN
jgi:hypothetical protein